ncbi:MAG: ABC transporter permease [Acidimicrobiales bacterium]
MTQKRRTGSRRRATTPAGTAGPSSSTAGTAWPPPETGFTYLRARYYDPATGQFVSRDPLTAMTGSPYSYVDGNPLDVRLSVAGIRPRAELRVLIKRYLSVIAADGRNLRLLVAQAPLIALLVWALAPADALAVLGAPGTPRGARNSASTVLLALTLGAAFMGLSNALREVVKELPVYQRERAVGLSISAYLGSKAIVLGVITVLQAGLLVAIGMWRQGHLGDGVTPFGPPKVEMLLAVALTGVAAMALGLMVSAVVTSADKALTLLPVVLLGLFLLSGPLFNLTNRPVLRELSYVTSTRWGYSALAATVDLEGIRGCKPADCQSSWEHSTGTWAANMAAPVALTVVPLLIAAWALRRRDPLRSWKRARPGRGRTRLG